MNPKITKQRGIANKSTKGGREQRTHQTNRKWVKLIKKLTILIINLNIVCLRHRLSDWY